MTETKNAPPRVGRWYRVGGTVMQYVRDDWESPAAPYVLHADDGAEVRIPAHEWPTQRVEQLGTTGQRFAALEARLLAPPAVARTPLASLDVTLPISPEEYARARSVVDDRLAACHVDHDACSAEQRGSAGRAAQGPCVRGVVDLVTPSADDQHAAERGTSPTGAEVTASDGGDTARADSATMEIREAVDMLVKAAELERVAESFHVLDSVKRAECNYSAKTLRHGAERRIEVVGERLLIAEAGVLNLSKRLADARAERDAASAKDHREFFWSGFPEPTKTEPHSIVPHEAGGAVVAASAPSSVVATTVTEKDDAMPPPNYERRLTYRFLTLPFRHQVAIANSLNLLTDEDQALSDEPLFHELFKRATAAGLLAKLWDETEKRHADPAPFKGFVDQSRAACPKTDHAHEDDEESDIVIAGRHLPFVQVGMIVHPDDCLNCERDGSPLWCSALVCDIHDDDETARFGMMATLLFRNGERREEPCDELRRRWRMARDFDQTRVYTGRWGAIPRGSVWPVAEVNEDA